MRNLCTVTVNPTEELVPALTGTGTRTGIGLLPGAGLRPVGSRQAAPSAGGPRVALVHLGNSGALGTTRRVAVWADLLASAGCDVVEVDLLHEHRSRVPSARTAYTVLRAGAVPETLTWSVRSVRRQLADLDPDAVVYVTARAFHPDLSGIGRLQLLDIQDRFSRSYRGRAKVDGRPAMAAAWRALARATARFEVRDHAIRLVAAGWTEAKEIGAAWVPNVVAPVDPATITDHRDADADLLFFGKLAALPNVDALRRLASAWPDLVAVLPSATCLVAGADLTPEVRGLADRLGWRTQTDFDNVADLCRRARIAVVPLRFANGIQNKVLEAAASGLPQVVSPQALAGMAPGFPAAVARSVPEMVAAVAALLADPERRVEEARAAHAHIEELYSVDRWAPAAYDLVTGRRRGTP